MDITSLYQQRGEIVDQMRAMLNAAEGENRDLNSEEQAKYDAMNADLDSIANRIKRAEAVEEASKIANAIPEPAFRTPLADSKPANAFATNEYDQYSRLGRNGIDHNILNALQVGTNSEGGFIVPTEFETTLVEYLQDINELRSVVNVISTGSDRNIPVESSLGTATWTAEEAAYTESDAAFGQVQLGAHKLGTIIKVSEELLQDSFFDVSSYLARNFAKRFGIAEESAFVNGDGSGKPTGIVGGSGLGVTAAGVAAITADELIDLFHAVPRQYRAGAVWLMNDSTAKLIRKLKDGDSQYLWQPGLQAGQPDTLLGRRVIVSTAMPTPATGVKSVVFGDMSGYYVADRQGMSMQRLNELYAANGQVGFRAWKRMDGKMVDATGIKHLIQA